VLLITQYGEINAIADRRCFVFNEIKILKGAKGPQPYTLKMVQRSISHADPHCPHHFPLSSGVGPCSSGFIQGFRYYAQIVLIKNGEKEIISPDATCSFTLQNFQMRVWVF
jgi:hypothetical protein